MWSQRRIKNAEGGESILQYLSLKDCNPRNFVYKDGQLFCMGYESLVLTRVDIHQYLSTYAVGICCTSCDNHSRIRIDYGDDLDIELVPYLDNTNEKKVLNVLEQVSSYLSMLVI